MMKDDVFDSLQKWYFAQCDGDWEHEYGILIDTLDNPGWNVSINLIGTECENKKFNEVDHQIDENNWLQCVVKDGKFIGSGGPLNLIDIIKLFVEWKNS